MKYFDLYASYPDYTIAAAWNSQCKDADKTWWLADTLAKRESEMFSRFAACHAELRALPRSARRAVQRRLARSSEVAAILPEYLQQGGRRLQHRMAWSLAGAALLLALGEGVASAATITITTNNPNIIDDGQCSLIEAIVNANDDAATHPDCTAGSGADTIVLPANANVILNSVQGFADDAGFPFQSSPIGLPEITSQIIIEGNGATIARQAGAPEFGLVAVRGLIFPSVLVKGNLTVRGVTLSEGSRWGAILNRGTLRIENSTISGNTGVGVFNNPGDLTVVNSTISGNTGVGLDNRFGSITVRNSTITGNRGGGILNYGWGGFYGSVLSLANSVVSGNQGSAPSEITNVYSYVYANNFNLIGSNGNPGVSGFTPGPTDIVPSVSLAQILGPLQGNGGPTQTHALVAGSPAIDAGDPSGCRDSLGTILTIDQRGFARQFDGDHNGTSRCDIGAYEFGSILVASSETFVRQQYLDFLDRDPEFAGLSGWVNALDAGLPRASLIEAFMDSGEYFFKGKFIAQIYLGLLTRDADFSGFRGWLEVLLTGVSHEQIVQWFLDSAEFTNRFGSSLTNSQFIERMYNNVLLRSTAPGEFNFWVEQLTTGQMTRAQVALGILDSDEFQNLGASQNRVDISLLYFDMLRRDPDPGGFSGWVGVLNSGVPLISVIDGFLNSTEYQTGF